VRHMPIDDDDVLAPAEEECPGPADLESALLTETLDKVTTQPPLVVDARATLAETISRMQQGSRGCALVVSDAGRLAGIFTERDVLMRVAGRPIDLGQTAVRDYMTRDPVTLPSDSSVAFALNRMLIEGFRHIPLVDERGRPTGVVSQRQLIEYLSDFFNRDLLNLPPEPRASSRSREGA
jgi:CBS domain-containing protein